MQVIRKTPVNWFLILKILIKEKNECLEVYKSILSENCSLYKFTGCPTILDRGDFGRLSIASLFLFYLFFNPPVLVYVMDRKVQ